MVISSNPKAESIGSRNEIRGIFDHCMKFIQALETRSTFGRETAIKAFARGSGVPQLLSEREERGKKRYCTEWGLFA